MNDHIQPADFFLDWNQYEILIEIVGWMLWSLKMAFVFFLACFIALILYWLATDKDDVKIEKEE